jgi:hypothetical protein
MEPTRKFKVIVNSKECGTCSGSSLSAVAKKVVKKLCGSSSKVVKFSLKECKRGCERVCGPYQGRMEKLDKPYTRDGKKITHRVVCGKVKKMRGGVHPNINKYLKNVDLIKKFIKELFNYCNDTTKNRKVIFFPRYIKGLINLYWYNIVPILNNASDNLENRTISEESLNIFKRRINDLMKDKKSLVEKVHSSVLEEHNERSSHFVFTQLAAMRKFDNELKAFIEYLIDKINKLMLDDDSISYLYDEIKKCLRQPTKSRGDCLLVVPADKLFSLVKDEIYGELNKNNNNNTGNGNNNNN